jgi:hypothetical protein
VSFEEIMRIDPEFILLGNFRRDKYVVPQSLYNKLEWQPLRAVQLRHIYLMPVHSFYNWPFDVPLLIQWMIDVFHPDDTPSEIRMAYQEIYREIYHYNLTTEEVDQALFMKENCGSAGYERFARDHGSCLLARPAGG